MHNFSNDFEFEGHGGKAIPYVKTQGTHRFFSSLMI